MRITIPVCINRDRENGVSKITVRTLFGSNLGVTGGDLGRMLYKLSDRLRDALAPLGRGVNHRELLKWHHEGSLDWRVLKLNLDLRDSTAKLKLMVVIQTLQSRRVVFSPTLPEQWFDWNEGESLEQRAGEFYQSYFRGVRKQTPEFNIAQAGVSGQVWIDFLELDIPVGGTVRPPIDPLRALLGGEDVSDGVEQLRKVGRCWNHIDAADLADPVEVDADIDRLLTLLHSGDRCGVVLVGPPGSGKTARIAGMVRKLRRRKSKRLVWQLSPARLISGMSYLGQWQERVLAILKYAHRRDQILYFDDLLGLLDAGKTRDSSMCVADMMRTQLENRPVRILAEMTPAAWAILQYRDPKMAARMIVVPTAAVDLKTANRMMIAVRQQLESQFRCVFDQDTLPLLVSLYDRFHRSSALPGKSIAGMRTIAAKHPREQIQYHHVIADFADRAGLRTGIIDSRHPPNREQLLRTVRQTVIGQDEAVNALLDRVMVAAARMNDRGRPIGAYLMIGPTGVGKTELAKSIADCLFDDGGLIRLDMNELSGPGSAARLIGTFDSPDGLLTAAVRRRPHAVLLLDEIEKAHPSVLDVLLPVLGEARLSDSRGRTVDFSGLLILMTSNLGSRESIRGSGFASTSDGNLIRQKHLKAVREYFRPEFFNRIDDILHFDRLSPESIQRIARIQFRRLLKRDGLQRRNVLIDIDAATIRGVAERGVDSKMGARALKRQIERELIRPAAETLSASPSDAPILLRMSQRRIDDQDLNPMTRGISGATNSLAIECVPIRYIKQRRQTDRSPRQWIDLATAVLDRCEHQIDRSPLSFETSDGQLNQTVLENLTIKETYERCGDLVGRLTESTRRQTSAPPAAPVHQPGSGSQSSRRGSDPHAKSQLQGFQVYQEIQDYWNETLASTEPTTQSRLVSELRIELGRLESQIQHRGRPTRWRVTMRWYGDEQRSDHSAQVLRDDRFQDPIDRDPDGVNIDGDETMAVVVRLLIPRWLTDQELLAVEPESSRQQRVPQRVRQFTVAGALASSSVGELCGGWMSIDEAGKVTLLEIFADPFEEAHQMAAAMRESAKLNFSNRPLPRIRRIFNAREGRFDLLAGCKLPPASLSGGVEELLRNSYNWNSQRYNDPLVDESVESSDHHSQIEIGDDF